MRLPGAQRIRLTLVWALGCWAAACSPYLERDAPGVFLDVQLTGSTPDTTCQELADSIAARMPFRLKWKGSLASPDQCGALLNEANDAPRREIWITLDTTRNLLAVELRELGASGAPDKPSRYARELGRQLAGLISERFPGARITQGKRFSGVVTP
jgi:hypothetical protein